MRALHVIGVALLATFAPPAIALTPPPESTITALSNLGQPVMGALAGDVDGDGFGDVILGSMAFEDGEFFEGALFFYYGGPGGIASGDLDSADTTVQSNAALAGLGRNVAAAGDLDSYDDLLISSDLAEARVYHGSATGIPSGDPATADATLTCPPTILGVPLSEIGGIGDVNGDGYDDVAVGCTAYDDAGRAMVFLGGRNRNQ